MQIEGVKVGIRKYRESDSGLFYEAVKESVETLQEFMPWCHHNYSLQESRLWVTSRAASWECEEAYSFVIYSIKNNELLGGVDINQINTCHKVGNIGYWVKSRSLKRGVATEAVSLISNFGFNSLGLNRLEIVMLPNNVASRKVAERSGAKYEGILQKRLFVREKALDACLYSLVKNV